MQCVSIFLNVSADGDYCEQSLQGAFLPQLVTNFSVAHSRHSSLWPVATENHMQTEEHRSCPQRGSGRDSAAYFVHTSRQSG